MKLADNLTRRRVLHIVWEIFPPPRRVFVGVIDPINPKVETPQEVKDRVLEAADFIPLVQLGTTDDCGFSPFGDDLSTARETAFAKIMQPNRSMRKSRCRNRLQYRLGFCD